MGISLADIAGMDVSAIEEVRFSTLPKGIMDFTVTAAKLDEGLNAENEQRFFAEFELTVAEVVSLEDKKIEPESLVGRKHTEKVYIVPEKAEEGIGLIRAFVADMGCPNEGELGAIVSDTKGTVVRGKISHRPDKHDPEKKYARLNLDAKANAKG
jgi:hypothetical protein